MSVRADLLTALDRIEAAIQSDDSARTDRLLDDLRATVMRLPVETAPIACPLCGLGRPNLAALANHIRVVHEVRPDYGTS